ncbi:MAG: replicative DNA helicase [Cytophagaceae bacterium]|jgi:replicative DNA helicase|nr:replicative DNA helicase [Cytophagaceae bacterium]
MAERRSNKNSGNVPPADITGKMPPQAVELEEVVLGAMLLERDAFATVTEILKPECFYKEAHQLIYEAIGNLFSREQPIDMLTATEELRRMGKLEEAGGAFYVTQLTGRVASAAHIEYHARIVYQKYLLREIIMLSSGFQTKAYDDTVDVEDLLEEAENQLFLLSQGSMKRDATQINPVLAEAIEKIQISGERTDGLSGVPSGFMQLDRITSGWQASDMIVVAARPAMGKTAFVLSMAKNMAVKYKQPVAFFSLEMSNVQLVNRLIVSETELPADKIKNGNLSQEEWEHLYAKVKNLEDTPLFVDDTAGLSIFELRAKCRRLKKQHNIKAVIIDYLQLMNASGMKPGNRQEEVSMISRSLKGLAKELNIPVIALSQLNRGVEGRTGEGKRPQLSDLRESGAIEQDADMVLFIHRPEYYGITEDSDNNSLLGVAEIIVAKHRNGATGDVRLRFRPEVIRFEDYSAGGFGEIVQTFGSKMNSTASTTLSPATTAGNGMPFDGSFRESSF